MAQLGQRGDQPQLGRPARRVAAHLDPAEQRERVPGQRERAGRVDRRGCPGWPGAAASRRAASAGDPARAGVRRGRRPGPRRIPPAAAAALCSRVTTTSVIIRTRPRLAGSPSGRAYASSQADLGGGQRPGAELVLEPVQATPGAGASGAASPASGESAAYRGTRNGASTRLPRAGAVRPGQRHRHRRVDGRAEPLLAGEPPGAVRRPARAVVVERPTSEPPCDSVIHCPLVIAVGRVGGDQPGQPRRRAPPGRPRDGTAARPRRRPSPPGR